MKGIMRVIYWHRLGVKVYKIENGLAPVIEKEINSKEKTEILDGLKFLSGEKIYLLLADGISYLYEKINDPPLPEGNDFKAKLLDLVRADIPEDFAGFDWDYKIEKTADDKQRVIVFAPTKEYQNLIGEVLTGVGVTVEAMETESVAATRDPNPVLGIAKKNDITGKDEEVLNLTLTPAVANRSLVKDLAGVVVMVVITLVLLVLVLKFGFRPSSPKSNILTPTVSSIKLSPTTEAVKMVTDWADLKILVENGTTTAGLAGKTATKFSDDGVKEVETGNADRDDYLTTKLYFRDEQLKNKYFERIKKIINVDEKEVEIDKSISNDVKLILGKN